MLRSLSLIAQINLRSTAIFSIIFLALTLNVVNAVADKNHKVVFQFPEYDYKESGKNELSFREFESACDQSKRCENLNRISRLRCVRECISPSCYREIYEFDEIEEGEIDVRLNSFKGCFIQRLGRSRSR